MTIKKGERDSERWKLNTRDAEPNIGFVCTKAMERKACLGVVNNSPPLPPQAWVNTPLVSLKGDG